VLAVTPSGGFERALLVRCGLSQRSGRQIWPSRRLSRSLGAMLFIAAAALLSLVFFDVSELRKQFKPLALIVSTEGQRPMAPAPTMRRVRGGVGARGNARPTREERGDCSKSSERSRVTRHQTFSWPFSPPQRCPSRSRSSLLRVSATTPRFRWSFRSVRLVPPVPVLLPPPARLESPQPDGPGSENPEQP
jgi:hypothetical protein